MGVHWAICMVSNSTVTRYFVYRAAFATISYHPLTDSFYVDYTDPWADIGETAGASVHEWERIMDTCIMMDILRYLVFTWDGNWSWTPLTRLRACDG